MDAGMSVVIFIFGASAAGVVVTASAPISEAAMSFGTCDLFILSPVVLCSLLNG
jgi:hypothetical protein